MGWFEVSKSGLKQLMEGKDKSYVLRELIQNAWDEPGVTTVHVEIEPIPGRPAALVTVEDDAPQGFYDIAHAYTMFGVTRKRKDPSKRGRFNLGEKQVLALAREAAIRTTTGTVFFKVGGTRTHGRQKTESGSIFTADIPMTRAEIEDAVKAAKAFIPPEGMATTVNGFLLTKPKLVASVPATLLTEFENSDGQYRSTRRKTMVDVYQPREGERPMIFEMGIPIIELEGGDCYHYDIQQRVPMTTDRDNVRPSFLQDVRAEVLNKVADKLSEEQARERWVTEGIEDDRIQPKAVKSVVTKRFGSKVVTMDPSDPNANDEAISKGFTVVPGGALSKSAWGNVKEASAIPSSSSLFGKVSVGATPIPESKWTPEMRRVVKLTRRVAKVLEEEQPFIEIVRSKADGMAYWGGCTITFNLTRLGRRWFRVENTEDQINTIVHELAHRYGHHTEHSYHQAICRFAAKLALASPGAVTRGINSHMKQKAMV